MSSPSFDEAQKQRARAAIVAAAVGDALGASYATSPELLAALGDGPVTFAKSRQWREGEWTSSTTMAVPVLKCVAKDWQVEQDVHPLNRVVSAWLSADGRDLGPHLVNIFARMKQPNFRKLEIGNRPLSSKIWYITGIEEGEKGCDYSNRAVARSVPVAVGHLGEGCEAQLVKAVRSTVSLTQQHEDVLEAAQLLALGMRSAILTGNLDLKAQIGHLHRVTPERKEFWTQKITEAEKSTPEAFKDTNETAIGALQAAIAANAGEPDVKAILERAVRAGGDCDRVACIAGALAGARGGSVPDEWREKVWGEPLLYPGKAAESLEAYVDRALAKQLQ
ncbi:putative ribosylglycohydrolase [Trichosporon asahii var. asahii CBS 2479]|uniref:ADP-ribosylhydrolase ARH3 n=1 Tax=Trichosporon asahii var. asahii (strain ATCC 90039 / CBS 2479 / JCM 2466 / KCTC 7840 / NBRC 103889/ NCYC 2677 / UAMH 7654) TaxID=1186058 RepID=J4UI80_TRIAS|nr:putative ribosylglycohydrolase [Trichosporon asahii var. asahii CBS 2479]EJT51360.1 putative ribosylglycohydrolase [Trichosporon asahii var. asahii CBS 2479]